MALVDVLAYMLAGKKGKDMCHDIRRDVEVEALVKTLAVRLAEVKAKTVSDTLGNVEAEALVNKFAATLEEMEAKKIGGTLPDV